ncbi:MAG TPA: chromate transporter [Clostridia bacterium]|nr:chromate transporter [Clostridia bacterium]
MNSMNRREIFLTALRFSCTTFGGGFVMISMMEKEFVEDLGILPREEMMDIAAIAQSAPGAVTVNAWILLGYRMAGLTGSLVAILGAILPPILIVGAISFFYERFIASSFISVGMKGMQVAVAAIIVDLVITLFKSLTKDGKIWDFILVILALVLTGYFHFPIYILLISYAIIGIWRKA